MSVALVLGASRGLGLLVSEQLLQRGYTVHGCAWDASELEAAARILTAVPAPGGEKPRFVPPVCDIRDARKPCRPAA